MTTGEAKKLLKENNFILVNQKGSHQKYSKNNFNYILIYHSTDKETLSLTSIKKLKNIIKESNKT